MPLYFFHVTDGVALPDKVGTYCASLLEARAQAIRASGTMIAELRPKFWGQSEGWRMDVTDEAGEPLFALQFSRLIDSQPYEPS